MIKPLKYAHIFNFVTEGNIWTKYNLFFNVYFIVLSNHIHVITLFILIIISVDAKTIIITQLQRKLEEFCHLNLVNMHISLIFLLMKIQTINDNFFLMYLLFF